MKRKDITGNRYGRLTVVRELEDRRDSSGAKYRVYECKCDCGNVVEIRMKNLSSGATRSCGCLRSEISKEVHYKHGFTHTSIHNRWLSMINRCKTDENYKNVHICDEWKDFENFYNWAIQSGYDEKLSIDRIDPYGDYEPSNCRWATLKEQANNKKKTKRYTINGVTHTASEWADIYGIPYKKVKERMQHGYSIEDALIGNFRKNIKSVNVKVVETGRIYDSINECSLDLGCNRSQIRKCIKGEREQYKNLHFEKVNGGC